MAIWSTKIKDLIIAILDRQRYSIISEKIIQSKVFLGQKIIKRKAAIDQITDYRKLPSPIQKFWNSKDIFLHKNSIKKGDIFEGKIKILPQIIN